MTSIPLATRAEPRAIPDQELPIWPRPREVHCARVWFHSILRIWPLRPDQAAEAAQAVFAEVVAEAVQHSRGRITIAVRRRAAWLICEVRDRNWPIPARRAREPAEEGGPGMIITNGLADDWGIRRRLTGRTVWFRIRLQQARPEGAKGP